MKRCSRCKKDFPFAEFRMIQDRQGKKRFTNCYCKPCENERNKEYIKNHPEWARAQSKRSYTKWKWRMIGEKCEICGETRVLDIAHIIPRLGKNGKTRQAWYNQKGNLLGLCPTHHRLLDEDKLIEEEYAYIENKIKIAKEKYA